METTLPHRTALCAQLCDFFPPLFKGSALSKNKLLFLLFISKFIIGKAINKKIFVYKGEQWRASLGCYDLKNVEFYSNYRQIGHC